MNSELFWGAYSWPNEPIHFLKTQVWYVQAPCLRKTKGLGKRASSIFFNTPLRSNEMDTIQTQTPQRALLRSNSQREICSIFHLVHRSRCKKHLKSPGTQSYGKLGNHNLLVQRGLEANSLGPRQQLPQRQPKHEVSSCGRTSTSSIRSVGC